MAKKIEFIMNISNTVNSHRKRWIGLADVRPFIGNDLLGDADGAFVAVVADAEDEHAFLALVESQFRDLQFAVLSLEDVELLELRAPKHQLPEDLCEAVTTMQADSMALGTFHSYSEND